MDSDPRHPAHLVTGQKVADRYRLISRIGGGGMGEVWKASDEILGRTIAVKLLRPELADDGVFRERLRREARAAGGISHRGVVPVFDFGEVVRRDAPAVPFIAMEFVDGPSLSEEIRQHGVLSADRTLLVVEQAASALQAAHDAGVIHRDVKPANILITPDGDVKIADFGIARSADTLSLTQTGTLTGTATYFSPEQAGGLGATAASDIYSLGVVAYACLTGAAPFSVGNDISIALAHIQQAPPALPSHVPAGLNRLVMSMLEKKPSDRPASAGAVATAARILINTVEPGVERPHPFPPAPMVEPATRSLPQSDVLAQPSRFEPAAAFEPAPETGRDRRFPLEIVVAVVVLAVLVGVLISMLSSGSTVPNAVGKQQSAATSLLSDGGLVATVQRRDIAGQPTGVVTAQSEVAGSEVDNGSTVALTVATGNVAIPKEKLLGSSYDDAAAILKKLGLTTARVSRVSARTAGSVLAVVPGDKAVNGSTVTLIVATAQAPAPSGNTGHGEGKNGKKGKNGKH